MWKNVQRFIAAGILVGVMIGCGDKASEPDEEAMESEQTAQVLRLSPESQSAIGLETATAVAREVPQLMAVTGWLIVPPGRETVVSATATGFITPSGQDSFPLGESIVEDQALARLRVFLSPLDQAQLVIAKEEADMMIRQSQASLELAEAQLGRVENTSTGAVAGTRLIELQEIVARSRAAEQEARDMLPYLPSEPYEDEFRLRDIDVTAPMSGWLIDVHVAPRQFVVQGDPLWTIADWSRLWVRVPVYTGDLPSLDLDSPIQAALPGTVTLVDAHPVDVPQPTEPGKQTVALLYEIENASGSLRPGQSLSVSLPTGESAEAIVIPQTAVLWDGFGDSWVYVRTSTDTFDRRRVELGQLSTDGIVVRRGLDAGDNVVVEGAEALYGEEFNWQLEAEDED